MQIKQYTQRSNTAVSIWLFENIQLKNIPEAALLISYTKSPQSAGKRKEADLQGVLPCIHANRNK